MRDETGALVDIALAVEALLGVAEYGGARTYEQLRQTWRDRRPLPTPEEIMQGWAQVRARRKNDVPPAVQLTDFDGQPQPLQKLARAVVWLLARYDDRS